MPHTNEQKRLHRIRKSTEDPDYYRRIQLKNKFGITIEQYDELFEIQKGNFAICERHQSEFSRRLAVDHCHHTNHIRGLLCASCNSGIGKLQDDIRIVGAALAYLHRHQGPVSLVKVVREPNVPELK